MERCEPASITSSQWGTEASPWGWENSTWPSAAGSKMQGWAWSCWFICYLLDIDIMLAVSKDNM